MDERDRYEAGMEVRRAVLGDAHVDRSLTHRNTFNEEYQDLITRYAHSSRVLVKKGDIVKRGQRIAEVGSTGRSTGPHLHFEVWVSGVPQDPARFLAAGETLAAAQLVPGVRRRP